MKKNSLQSVLCLSGVLAFGGTAQAAQNEAALKALFDQANYWHEKSHDDLASESLKKVLMVDANNTQALYLMALWAQQNGDLQAAAQWRARLANVSPNDGGLQALDNAKQLTQVPQGTLTLARQQARSGNIPAALATWKTLFNGDTPPASLAPEYYQTMGSDKSLYPEALAELQRFAAQNPQDNAARVALGKMLTWQESTRRDGIIQLQQMASGSKDADAGLRQALLWLGPKAGDEQFYDTWLQRHPQDSEVQAYYRKNVGGAAKGEGFTALNSGNTDAARRQFEQVLQTNPQDADALAGMGYIAQRSGDYQAAAQYLGRAASQGGDASTERQQQADDAAFYGQLAQAQQALKEGNVSQALALSAPLVQQSGERGTAARLFRADVLRHNKDYPQAEQTLRELLNQQPNNGAARENLYYVLKEQNKTAEAQAMLRTLPASLQAKLQPRVVTGLPGDPIRRQAQQAAASGNTQQAIAVLREGIARLPDDPWLRLDLARLLQKSGADGEAASVMQPAFRQGAGASSLYAAALFASENGAWQQSQTILSRISTASQTPQMRELAQRVNYNLQMATAERYLAQGNSVAAANTLKTLSTRPPENPADAGKLARMLAQSGDLTGAVAVVRSNMRKGVQGNAGDYADQVSVLNQAGLSGEAQSFLANPELLARSTPTQLAGVRNGYVINEADQLREQGNYAAAYDKLIRALQSDPQNTDLMFAMARLYQTGKMNKEAGVVYDYLMTRDTPDQDARAGAIDVALAEDNVVKAKQLANGLQNNSSPERLVLLARLEEAQGNHQQAMTYLRSARGKLLGLQSTNSAATPTMGGLLLADNPFVSTSRTAQATASSDNGLPWQLAQTAREPGSTLPGTTRPDLPQETAQSRTLRQVDEMMQQMNEQTGMWLQGGVDVRGRDGESGTSKLTEAKAPLTWSSLPFGESRFEFTATPITLSAGSASGDARRRFGSNPLANAASNMVATATNEQKAIAAMNATERATYLAAHPGAASLVGLGDLDSNDFNLTSSDGQLNLAKLGAYDGGKVGEYLEASNLKANVNQPGDVSTDSQKANGVELNMALSGKDYRLDVGSTPLGQDLSTLVGGVKWSPKLTNYLSLIMTGERRAVTDSLLSYVGLEDKYSGKRWGRVTKNGGSLQLSYDDGDAGFYAGGGGYSYLGENVASNTSINANAGVYLRPYHDDFREVKTGLSMSWMDFSKNLSQFTFGQGGYFSPQNYVSVSLPIDYAQKIDNWKLKLGGSVGYQSYSQDSSDYFPTNDNWQQLLEGAVESGFAKEATYKGTSENGIGYTVRAGVDYNVNKDMTIGGTVGYDTFGSYNESTAGLYFRYMLGDK
ncbi:cellulose biosynthesis protein BcsC [Lelliottia nimipressuralis]|uniref:BCSC C-terminal domain-containing protein n=1 Tax=Lelliottia nimipressuralis TaxID=69220 RepID=A0ABD4KE53_9ENTR|nr:cellulose biosynthesis protein BcsC [Lelliottia nimipressuralis]MBF4179142.1 BCSC C-terminal domain-containing protein [Lelliottia nimipressuralis]